MIRNIIWTAILLVWSLVLIDLVLWTLFMIILGLTYDGGPL